ncbi:MAG: GNAT family N-acyltransferase [Bacteroidota bacterium]
MNEIKNFLFKQLSFLIFKYFSTKDKLTVSITDWGEPCPEVYRLRYRVYSELDVIAADHFADQSFTDKYEPYSSNVKIKHKNKLVGTMRLTHASHVGFPTENQFNINPKGYDHKVTIEIGRLVIDKSFRGNKRTVSFAIGLAALRYSRENGFDHWLCNSSEKLVKAYRKLGVKAYKLSEGKPGKRHLEERDLIKGFYDRYDIYPYLIKVSAIKPRFLI